MQTLAPDTKTNPKISVSFSILGIRLYAATQYEKTFVFKLYSCKIHSVIMKTGCISGQMLSFC